MDFSMWIQSPTDLGMLFLSAMLIGMSKTGIQGISLLAVPLMAMTFGAKPSTGLILPILCVADWWQSCTTAVLRNGNMC